MMITVNNYESKKYDVESKSIIKMHDLTEIMQINNIIEHSIEQKDRSGYEVFIDILEIKKLKIVSFFFVFFLL